MKTAKIKYIGQPLIRILGRVADPRYNRWERGEVKEVPDTEIDCLDAQNVPCQQNAIAAIYTHGPDWVDEATGKNPIFTCAGCGGYTDHSFFRTKDLDKVDYVNADGDPVCVPCFLLEHPEHIEYHENQGMPRGLLDPVKAKLAAPPASTKPSAPPKPTPAPVPAAPAGAPEAT